jgi:hypothetical protein
VKPQLFQWLTAKAERRRRVPDYLRAEGLRPSVKLLAAVPIAANALILNSLFTISACNA